MLGVGNAVGEWLWNDRDEETEDGVDKESYVSKVVDVQFWILTNVYQMHVYSNKIKAPATCQMWMILCSGG